MRDGWHFALTDSKIAVFEPIGWDAVTFTLRRSLESGIDFVFSDELTFDRNGGALLKRAYDAEGIDAQMPLWIKYVECGATVFEYSGIVNFNIYKESEDGVSVGIKQSGFEELFKNRIDVPVNVLSEKTLDNGSMSLLQTTTIPMHSKQISLLSTWNITPLLANYLAFNNRHAIPFELKSSEVEESLQPGFYTPYNENPVFYSGFTYPSGITSRTITIRGRVAGQARIEGIGSFSRIKIHLLVMNRDQNVTHYNFLLMNTVSLGTDEDFFLFDTECFEHTIDIPADSNVFLYAEKNANISLRFNYNTSLCFLNISEDSIFPESTAQTLLAHEFLSRIVECITGQADAVRSNFFGRTELGYGVDGAGSLLALTNGLAIRNFVDTADTTSSIDCAGLSTVVTQDAQPRAISCSFTDAFDSLNAIFNLGYRVESDNGEFYLRIEPKSYFYNNSPILELENVAGIVKTPDLALIPNEFESGYQKWESEDINGIDEFNSRRNYVLPVRSNKRKLSAVSRFIAGGYPIEFTRRQQFAEKPTTDWKFDEDIFVIALLRDGEGFRPERDEDFAPIAGLLSPATAYNIRLSPARMAQNWLNVLSAATAKKSGPMLSFVSGSGNYKMATDDLRENQDLSLSVVPLFLPEKITFDYPISFAEFLSLRENAIFALSVSCDSLQAEPIPIRGFISEVRYQPNKDGGIAEFELLAAPSPAPNANG